MQEIKTALNWRRKKESIGGNEFCVVLLAAANLLTSCLSFLRISQQFSVSTQSIIQSKANSRQGALRRNHLKRPIDREEDKEKYPQLYCTQCTKGIRNK
ncbi:hypothetical protein HHI36_005066 [Cryptolaemus montrouzieri]|uniref:Uncharacterized protein n=1 Tax=Cryptolaemus montrouzieri TaxID=559131 RepID=A0ABD2NU14_9CUCU